jgi:hypothetical protein
MVALAHDDHGEEWLEHLAAPMHDAVVGSALSASSR